MRAQLTIGQTSDQVGGSQLLDRVIGLIRDAFSRLGDLPTNNALVPATLQPNIEKRVDHGLSGSVTTIEVVRQNQPAIVYESSRSPNPAKYVLLTATNTVSPVDLLIRFT